MITIRKASSEFVREPLLAPFGFKGNHVNELWQTAVRLESANAFGIGLGVQSVLWSDAAVFSENCESGGNALMFALTNYACKLCQGRSFETPESLLDELIPLVWQYGKTIANARNMRLTFVLNALVPLDFAAWVLFAREHSLKSFDQLIPSFLKPALKGREEKLSRIPLIPYGLSSREIEGILDSGDFLLKIKIGSDPEGDHDPEKMLNWDKKRLSQLHELAGERTTPFTNNGRIAYYLDANGRYPDKDSLTRFLDHADHIGALDRIVLLEEPFDETNEMDFSGFPVRIAADESAHCEKDAIRRMEMGCKAIALKPIAKTLSMTFRILRAAHERGVPAFCADLTVNPTMAEWNKNMAARIAPIPGIKIGVMETNGHQNYRLWKKLLSYHPCAGEKFVEPIDGLFQLDDGFYSRSGGILEDSSYYCSWFHETH